eukprot:3521747-Rhodomonas_salina.3
MRERFFFSPSLGRHRRDCSDTQRRGQTRLSPTLPSPQNHRTTEPQNHRTTEPYNFEPGCRGETYAIAAERRNVVSLVGPRQDRPTLDGNRASATPGLDRESLVHAAFTLGDDDDGVSVGHAWRSLLVRVETA